MTVLFGCLCVILSGITAGCLWKIRVMRKSAEELTVQFEKRIKEDTNVGIEISSRDSKMRQLALGMDRQIRIFREEQRRYLQGNQELKDAAANLSHDLRTPLTSLMIYTEILRQGDMEDKEQLENYIDKIHRKAHQIKILSDHIFEYSLVSGREEVELEEAEDMGLIFYDSLSEMAAYLEQQGYGVTRRLQWNGCRIRINQEYISRILDNITSNILKYARQNAPVQIGTVKAEEEEAAGIYFETRIEKDVDDRESTKIGIQSVEKMMQKMGGYCQVEKEEELFKITLWFPAVREE